MKVYISGKISGMNYEDARHNFLDAEEKLKSEGYEVFNPFAYGERIFGEPGSLSWDGYMMALLPFVTQCDAIYMLDGWQKSYGANIEYLWAIRCDKKLFFENEDDILDSMDDVLNFVNKNNMDKAIHIKGNRSIQEEKFREITNEMAELHARKNADYGDSFGQTYRELGIISAVTRMSDKMNRLKRLVAHKDAQQVKDESIDDTLIDLACYAVMTLMERRRREHE